jgi:hypothetical protein
MAPLRQDRERESVESSVSAGVRVDIERARSMTLVAMALQGIVLAAGLLGGFIIAFVFPVWPALPPWVQALIISGWVILAAFPLLTYCAVYRKLATGRVHEATAPALLLGVLGLLLGGVLPGVFLIAAYFKASAARSKILHSRGETDAHAGGRESTV